MEGWKHDFIEGLKQGKPESYLAKMCAGLPLAVVQEMREADPDFKAAWDDAVPAKKATSQPGRTLTPGALEAILWAQCSDAMAAAYFGMDVEVFTETVKADDHLNHVYNTAREGGKAALQQAQFSAAMEGDKTMLQWLGKQYLSQADAGADQNSGRVSVTFNISDPSESYRQLLGGATPAMPDVIEVEGEKVEPESNE